MYPMLVPGDPATWFEARSSIRPTFSFDNLGGRYIVLSFFGSASRPQASAMLDEFARNHARFDILNACFCGVSIDPGDEKLARFRQQYPGIFCFWDFDRAVSSAYGAVVDSNFIPHTLIIDPSMRVVATLPEGASAGEAHARVILELLAKMPPVTSLMHHAPALCLPGVFEPDLCQALIAAYEATGGRELGVLREVDGRTVRVHDHSQKRRSDCTLTDPSLLAAVDSRLRRRVFPEITRAFQFHPTRIERYNVACYDAADGGHFRAHRDDSTRGSAHRRFAVTLNLNANGYEGGDLRFPEYGFRTYRAPTGGAIVFSCTMLHEVRPVTRGKRYAFLPFIYDEAAARIRDASQQFLGQELQAG